MENSKSFYIFSFILIISSLFSCCLLVISNYLSSGVTGGGGQVRGSECPPETSDEEISADLLGKRKKGKRGGREMEKKIRKLVKGKVENLKWKEEKLQNEERTFFFFFFFLLLTFQNHKNLFWVYQNENFLLGKSISRQKKNQEK